MKVKSLQEYITELLKTTNEELFTGVEEINKGFFDISGIKDEWELTFPVISLAYTCRVSADDDYAESKLYTLIKQAVNNIKNDIKDNLNEHKVLIKRQEVIVDSFTDLPTLDVYFRARCRIAIVPNYHKYKTAEELIHIVKTYPNNFKGKTYEGERPKLVI